MPQRILTNWLIQQLPVIGQLLLSIAGLSLILSTNALGQDTTWRYACPTVLRSNLLAPVSIVYERAILPRFALRVSARALAGNLVFHDSRFANVAVEGKLYTARSARLAAKALPGGFFVSPYVKARSLRYVQRIGYGFTKEGDRDEIIVNSLGCGLTIGYQWVIRRGFVVEVVHGQGGFFANDSRHTLRYGPVTSSISDLTRVDFRSGVSLGYAF